MTRAQCIVTRGDRLLMVRHHLDGVTWWCLPGGGVEPDETPGEAALRELEEECGVSGIIIRETNHLKSPPQVETITFLVDIGEQAPIVGQDPEFHSTEQVIVGVEWLTLAEIPERDRALLWSAGLLSIPTFYAEAVSWGDDPSYPGSGE